MRKWQSEIHNLVIGKWVSVEPLGNEEMAFQQIVDYQDERYFKQFEESVKGIAVICVNGYHEGLNNSHLAHGILHHIKSKRSDI